MLYILYTMNYPAKILLFGEYGIILNSMALAMPYPRFSGQFKFSDPTTENHPKSEIESNDELIKLLNYLKTNYRRFKFINLEHFENEVKEGLYFDSSIPFGSGLGSSGSLTAAIYERYLIYAQHNEFQSIKTDLAAIETYFHGKSSGFDPLVSLFNKPLLLKEQSSIISDIDLSTFFTTYTLFLINSNSKGNTGTLVSRFMEKYQNQDFKKSIDNEYIPLINQSIEAVTASDFKSFDSLITRYSQFQLTHFEALIQPRMKTYFEHGLTSNDFLLKLCGSGGGGYILGITRNRNKTESYFNLNHIEYMVV